jgi:mannose-6-phosphate isomerase-like protein (cupin superfamily)
MHTFELAGLQRQRAVAGRAYLEFLRVPQISMGVYQLAAGGLDLQQPHREDEVYYVVEGRATVTVGNEDREVEPGTIVYVPADVAHRFHTIREDLTLLVFFAPAESAG